MKIPLRQKIICLFLILLTAAGLVTTVIALNIPMQYEFKVGDFSPETIYASRQITDTVTTEERRNAAADMVSEQYKIDFNATEKATKKFMADISALSSARDESALADSEDSDFSPVNSTTLSSDIFDKALLLSDSNFAIIKSHIPELFDSVMTQGITDIDSGLLRFVEYLDDENITNDAVREVASALFSSSAVVNKTPDPEKTAAMRNAESSSVETVVYQKNQVIIEKGDRITPAHFRMLSELGYVKGESYIDLVQTISGILLVLFVYAAVIAYYIFIGRHHITTTHSTAAAICSLLIILGIVMVFLSAKSDYNIILLLPISMICALIAMLLDANLASCVNLLISVLIGLRLNDFSASLALIISGTAASYIFSRVRRRSHLLSATLVSALIYSFMYTVVLTDTSEGLSGFFSTVGYSFLGGFFGGIFTIGTIPFMESIFDVITPMKLGELSNPEHKLLKKLLLKAPGSYHHSLTVANMADAAAEAIGANALLARVGAYYHDIGKMENPFYFKENQFGVENPHDSLSPEESAKIIIRHVSDGAHLASVYHLPTAVRNIILQHHGTTTTSFFLHKARENDSDVDPSIFTYDGPKPESREATVIMLADACEAAVRAMREKGSADVAEIVDNIVSSRVSEGQLSSSRLTFADLDLVKAAFVKTLEQYFHKRIIYPQNKN